MAERIFVRDQQGELEALEEEDFLDEEELQKLIAEYPALLDGVQMRPDDPRRWILIAREQGIPETAGEGAWWSLDHLLVDQDAIPTLVEVKRGANPEIRRSVVGQMLEYAAHATQTWDADRLRQSFEESTAGRGLSPREVLGELLLSDSEPDADEFWQRVATNLKAARLRLLFVADRIPAPLKRVAEFLNNHMPHVEVLAVEIKRFQGRSAQTLVPRVFGSAGSPSPFPGKSPKMTPAEFLADLPDAETRAAADRLLAAARRAGVAVWGPSGVTIKGRYAQRNSPLSVAWLYPPSKLGQGWQRTRDFTFGESVTAYEDPNVGEDVRTVLRQWTDQFGADAFTEDASSKGVTAWAVGYDDVARHIDLLEERLSRVLALLAAL